MMRLRHCTLLVVITSALFACEEAPPERTRVEFTPLPAMDVVQPQPACADETVDWIEGMVPRRLSSFEYVNSVRDLFGIELEGLIDFPPDEETMGFDNNARALQASPIHIERYFESAETIAVRAAAVVEAQLECDISSIDESCLRLWLIHMGRRVWRRPMTPEELERFIDIFNDGIEAEESDRYSLSRVVEALLQSPHFLYRIELGERTETPGIYQLNGYEVASRLSFLAWRTTPNIALLDAAERGDLDTSDGRLAVLDALLDDPRAETAWWSFFEQWLHLDHLLTIEKEERLHPDFRMTRTELYEEARAFVFEHGFGAASSIRGLLNTPFQIDSEPSHARRSGILSTRAWLAVHAKPNMTSPIHRGVFVREQLLCTALPPPPPEAMVTAPDPNPNLSAREQYEVHRAQAACSSCHLLIDPVGLVFENFDEVGRWRDRDNGKLVDSSGEVHGSQDLDGPLEDHLELVEGLSTSEQVHRCFNVQIFRFLQGRGERPADACWLEKAYQVYQDNDTNLRSLLRHYAAHPAFTQIKREVPDGS